MVLHGAGVVAQVLHGGVVARMLHGGVVADLTCCLVLVETLTDIGGKSKNKISNGNTAFGDQKSFYNS